MHTGMSLLFAPPAVPQRWSGNRGPDPTVVPTLFRSAGIAPVNDHFDGILNRDQIRTLIGVVDQGSFRRAAALLGVQQPAVTQ